MRSNILSTAVCQKKKMQGGDGAFNNNNNNNNNNSSSNNNNNNNSNSKIPGNINIHELQKITLLCITETHPFKNVDRENANK